MDKVTVSSNGRISSPKRFRDALNLSEGATLTLEVRGQQIVLSKERAWRKLRGAAAGRCHMLQFEAFRKRECERGGSSGRFSNERAHGARDRSY